MSRLCLGTFFKAIVVCVEENSFTQSRCFREVFSCIDDKYGPDPDTISKFVRGVRNPNKEFIERINDYDPDQYDSLCHCMNNIANMFNPQSECLLVKTITKIVNGDDTIPESQPVDLVNGTLKKDFPGNYIDLPSFLTGVFLYTLKFVDNSGKTEYSKEIDKLFLADLIEEPTKNSGNANNDLLSEDETLRVRQYLVEHESETDLIPLCQIAFLYNPDHNYQRSMYTEYNLLSEKLRSSILDKCNVTARLVCDKLYWMEGLALLEDDLIKYKLSSERYIYMFGQHFPRFQYYVSKSIKGYDCYQFKRLVTSKIIATFPKSAYSNLDHYINDYIGLNNSKKRKYPKPMDYLVETLIADATEEDAVFWLCRFIIDACDNLSHRVLGKTVVADCYDDNAETIEDLSLSALFALHRHYMFHQSNSMGMEFSWSKEE
jgi:hypothetical protein